MSYSHVPFIDEKSVEILTYPLLDKNRLRGHVSHSHVLFIDEKPVKRACKTLLRFLYRLKSN